MWCPFNDLLLRKKVPVASAGAGVNFRNWVQQQAALGFTIARAKRSCAIALLRAPRCICNLVPSFAEVKSSCSCRWREESSARLSLLHRIPFNLRQILFLTTPFEESRQMPLLLPEAIPWEERQACRAARARGAEGALVKYFSTFF